MQQRNIYQLSREKANLTQEKASELLDISVDSLRAYEGFKRTPPSSIVLKMIDIYNDKLLAYQYMNTDNEVSKNFLPDIQIKDLPTATLTLLKEINDFLKIKDDIVDITYEGEIKDYKKWSEIIEKLDKLSSAILTLKFVE